MIIYSELQSSLGLLLASIEDNQLRNIWFPGQKHEPSTETWQRDDQHPLFQQLAQQLQEYADGERDQFDLPLEPKGTEFQQAVWQALQGIQYGELSSYGALAKQLGKPKASRAVGAAVGKNPLSILIPCHRVLGGNGALTGFASGLDMKRKLLTIESSLPENS